MNQIGTEIRFRTDKKCGPTDRRNGQTDEAKTISLRLRRGDNYPACSSTHHCPLIHCFCLLKFTPHLFGCGTSLSNKFLGLIIVACSLVYASKIKLTEVQVIIQVELSEKESREDFKLHLHKIIFTIVFINIICRYIAQGKKHMDTRIVTDVNTSHFQFQMQR